MTCIDPMMKVLNKKGYNMVRVPKEGIQPLELIGRQYGRFEREGSLRYLVSNPPDEFPEISPDRQATDINGTRTNSLKIGLGVNILETLLKALGGTIGVNANFEWAQRIAFEFTDVFANSVDPLAVGHCLRNGEVDAANPLLKRYVQGVGKLYMITETLKSSSLTVQFESNTSAGGGVALPAIKEIVSGNIEIEGASGREDTIEFKGDRQLVFAFRAHEVVVEDGDLALQHARRALVLSAGAEEDEAPNVPPIAEAGFFELGD